MNPVSSFRFPIRVVAVGGGTGLPTVLRGMKQTLFPDGADDPGRLVAVVTVTDEGGSSGRLRDELGVLPPGDIRNCMVALSHNEPLMSRLFQARYKSSGALNGHSVGNLILVGLAQFEESGFLGAIKHASEVLNIQGLVYPSTLTPTRLVAHLDDGREVIGETEITAAGRSVAKLDLEPATPKATDGLVEAIARADVIVFGPGSLYTSILPNLLIPELAEAVRNSNAFRLLILNAMTEPGETISYSAADHLRKIEDHAGRDIIDAVLVADDEIPEETLARYREDGANRVDPDDAELAELAPMVIRRPLLQVEPLVRHDPLKTAAGVFHSYTCWAARVPPDAERARLAQGAE